VSSARNLFLSDSEIDEEKSYQITKGGEKIINEEEGKDPKRKHMQHAPIGMFSPTRSSRQKQGLNPLAPIAELNRCNVSANQTKIMIRNLLPGGVGGRLSADPDSKMI